MPMNTILVRSADSGTESTWLMIAAVDKFPWKP